MPRSDNEGEKAAATQMQAQTQMQMQMQLSEDALIFWRRGVFSSGERGEGGRGDGQVTWKRWKEMSLFDFPS